MKKKYYIIGILFLFLFIGKVQATEYNYYVDCSYVGIDPYEAELNPSSGDRCIPSETFVVGSYLYSKISYLTPTNLVYAYASIANPDFFDVYNKVDDGEWYEQFGSTDYHQPYYNTGGVTSETVCITHIDGVMLPNAECPRPTGGGGGGSSCEDDELKNVRFTYINAEGEEVSSRNYSLCPGAILYANQVPVVPDRTGLKFNKWIVKKKDGNIVTNQEEFKIGDKINNNYEVEATYVYTTYNITYDLNGGDLPASGASAYDQNYTCALNDNFSAGCIAPSNPPTRNGYDFLGWSTKVTNNYYSGEHSTIDPGANIGSLLIDSNVGGSNDVTLYAVWKPHVYDITYDLNGEAVVLGQLLGTLPGKYTVDQVIRLGEPSRPGYTFGGWYTDPSFDQDSLITNTDGKTTDLYLYAKWTAASFTVTYKVGDEDFDPIPCTYNNCLVNIDDPTQAGFLYWIDNENGYIYKKGNSIKNVSTNITLNAVFSTDGRKTITYADRESYSFPNQPVESYVPNVPTNLPIPEKDGYIFNGWTINGTGRAVYSLSENYNTDLTLTPNWSEKKITVVYDYNNGEADVTYECKFGQESCNPPANPTKTGYIFKGWSLTNDDDDLINNTDSYLDIINGVNRGQASKTLKLHAIWEEDTHLILYNLDGGIANFQNATTSTSLANNNGSITLPSSVTKDGWTFTEWEPVNAGLVTGDAENGYKLADNISTGVPVTFKANYSRKTLNIKYLNDNVSYGDDQTCDYINICRINKHNPTHDNYVFKYWLDPSRGLMYPGYNSIVKDVYGELNLVAIYNDQDTHSIILTNDEGATYSGAPIRDYVTGVGTNLPIPSKPGYKFTGWKVQNTDDIIYSIPANANTDYTLEAQWSKKTYHIYYALNGGINNSGNTDSFTIHDDTSNNTITLGAPTHNDPHYLFGGWTVLNPSSSFAVNDGQITINDYENLTDIVLAANWIHNEYEIVYDLNGNGAVNGTGNVTSYGINDDPIVITNPTRANYSFTGWEVVSGNATLARDPENNQNILTVSDSHGDVYLKATWSKDLYSINYDLNGTGAVNGDNNPVSYNPSISDSIVITNPTRDDYVFMGWEVTSGNADLSEGPENDQNTLTVLSGYGDVYLKAIWSPNRFKINYDLNGGTASNNPDSYYLSSSDPILITDPTRTGYDFNDWEVVSGNGVVTGIAGTNTSRLFANALIGGDINIRANWVVSTRSINIDLAGGEITGYAPTSYTYGTTSVSLSKPVKTGYVFAGWTITPNTVTYDENNNKLVLGSNLNEDVELVANWNPDNVSVTYCTSRSDQNDCVDQISNEMVGRGSSHVIAVEPVNDDINKRFLYWISDDGRYFTPGQNVIITDNIKFYPYYYDLSEVHTITYNLNGGLFTNGDAVDRYRVGDTFNLTESVSLEGHMFMGWYTDPDFAESSKITGVSNSNTDLVLYAKWAQPYKIVLHSSDGEELLQTIVRDNMDDYTLGPITVNEHPVLNWSSQANIRDVTYTSETNWSTFAQFGQVYDLYAIEDKYTIVLHTNDGNTVLDTITNWDLNSYQIGAFTIDDHDVVKWASQPNSREVAYTAETDWAGSEFGKVYNLYAIEDFYTIRLHSNDGNEDIETIVRYNKNNYSLGAKKYNGRNVYNWSTVANDNTIRYDSETDFGSIAEYGNEFDLYAIYTVKVNYHYEAYLDGGRSPEMEKEDSITYKLGDSVDFDTLSGYAGSDGNATLFNNLEWYTDDSYTDQFDLTTVFDINSPEEIYLYAREDFYTVTFHHKRSINFNAINTDSIVIVEDGVIDDSLILYFGSRYYDFNSIDWYTDGFNANSFDITTPISEKTDLYGIGGTVNNTI